MELTTIATRSSQYKQHQSDNQPHHRIKPKKETAPLLKLGFKFSDTVLLVSHRLHP